MRQSHFAFYVKTKCRGEREEMGKILCNVYGLCYNKNNASLESGVNYD